MTQQLVSTRSRAGLRGAAVAGLAAPVLIIGGNLFGTIGGAKEPPVDGATAADILQFMESRDEARAALGSFLAILGLFALLWFICGMYAALRHRADREAWLPTVALASGAAMVGSTLLDPGGLVVPRVDEGLDPQLARLAFDWSSLAFANSWLALGSFAIATGGAILSTRGAPNWLGWWAVLAGVGLIAARAMFAIAAKMSEAMWFFPYMLFWIWVIVVSVRLLAGRSPSPDQPQPAGP